MIKQWQSGDSGAFEALFHHYKNMVFRTALLMVGDAGQAEDILQEAFVKVYRSRDKFKGDEINFGRWLHRITTNICIDNHRKKQVPASSLEEMGEVGFESAGMDCAHSRFEKDDLIWQALESLDSKHRVVVILKYFHELLYEEIAQILNIPVGTVKSRLNTAVKTLRRELKNIEGKPYL